MVNNIDLNTFTKAIHETYKTMNMTASENFAKKIIAETDARLEPALIAWINGTNIPDVSYGDYSIHKILTCRNSSDYLMAIQLLSLYMNSPEEGIKKIRKPIRGMR